MRGIRHERALPGECVVQAVEHVVERLGEKADLVTGAGGPHAVRDVAGVHLGRGARHAPQRARHSRRDEIAGHGRGQEGEHAGEQERTAHAVLRAHHRRERLAHAHPRDGLPIPYDAPHVHAQPAEVDGVNGRVALRRISQFLRRAVLGALHARRLRLGVNGGGHAE